MSEPTEQKGNTMTDTGPLIVWVVTPTDYDQYGFDGIYDTPETALAAYAYADWAPGRPDVEGRPTWDAPRSKLSLEAEPVQRRTDLQDHTKEDNA